jgi:hypothetical protein
MTETRPRVVIYVDQNGNWSVQADPGVDVYSVDELVPHDRVYQMNPDHIEDGVLDGEVHHENDGSAAAARITRAVREAHGMPAFEVIERKPS